MGHRNASLSRAWVLEIGKTRITVDTNMPTERNVLACRPDHVLYWEEKKVIVVFEVACAWEPLVLEREKEKWLKYEPLATDIAARNRISAVIVMPIVVGTLGVIGSMHERLKQLKLFPASSLNTVIADLQMEAIQATTQILRSQLSTKGRVRGGNPR